MATTVLDRFRLDGRVAAVTGTSRGIGRALAVALAEAGADIAQVDRSDADETAAAIRAAGRTARPYRLDLAACSAADCAALVAAVVADCGRLDVLVNSAGIVGRGNALDVDDGVRAAVLATDLAGPLELAVAAGRHMVGAGGGKIVNVGSLMSFQGGIGVSAYAAAKHGLLGATRALANEWAAAGVQVNALIPGYVATDINADLRDDAARFASISDRIPAGRWGAPEDLVGAVVFLASPASDYVTGSALAVDGGWLAR